MADTNDDVLKRQQNEITQDIADENSAVLKIEVNDNSSSLKAKKVSSGLSKTIRTILASVAAVTGATFLLLTGNSTKNAKAKIEEMFIEPSSICVYVNVESDDTLEKYNVVCISRVNNSYKAVEESTLMENEFVFENLKEHTYYQILVKVDGTVIASYNFRTPTYDDFINVEPYQTYTTITAPPISSTTEDETTTIDDPTHGN